MQRDIAQTCSVLAHRIDFIAVKRVTRFNCSLWQNICVCVARKQVIRSFLSLSHTYTLSLSLTYTHTHTHTHTHRPNYYRGHLYFWWGCHSNTKEMSNWTSSGWCTRGHSKKLLTSDLGMRGFLPIFRAQAGLDLQGPYCFFNEDFFIPNHFSVPEHTPELTKLGMYVTAAEKFHNLLLSSISTSRWHYNWGKCVLAYLPRLSCIWLHPSSHQLWPASLSLLKKSMVGAASQHDAATTMFHGGDGVVRVMCSVSCLPHIVFCI